MLRLSRSVVLVVVGFAAGVATATVSVALAQRNTYVPWAHTYSVAVDEVKQNLVEPQLFSNEFHQRVTLSDGTVREITLRSEQENGQPLIEFLDKSSSGTFVSYMGPNGTTTNGTLMVSVKDASAIRTQMEKATGKHVAQ